MRGDWVAFVARHVLTPHTFDLTVSPAVADLQCETPSGMNIRVARHYVGVWLVFLASLCLDTAMRIGTLLTWRDRSPARADLAVFGQLLLLQIAYYGGLLTLGLGLTGPRGMRLDAAVAELTIADVSVILGGLVSLAIVLVAVCVLMESRCSKRTTS